MSDGVEKLAIKGHIYVRSSPSRRCRVYGEIMAFLSSDNPRSESRKSRNVVTGIIANISVGKKRGNAIVHGLSYMDYCG